MEGQWTERGARLFVFGGLAVGVLLVLRWLSPLVWVLLLSGAVAAVVDPLARKTAKKCPLPRKLWAGIYVILLLLLLGTAVGMGVRRLWQELSSLGEWMNDHPGWLEERLQQLSHWVQGALGRLSLPGGEEVGSSVEEWLRREISQWGDRLGNGARDLLVRTPEVIMTLVVGILSCFYLSIDGRELVQGLTERLPQQSREKLCRTVRRLKKGIRRYLRAYVLLMIMTFGELWAGLTILRQPYAFLLAAGIALVDILPVLGAGTVLLPWAVGAFLFHRGSLGVGLLILYGVITIVRQVAEPYFVGGSLGVHPLWILLCAYAAFLLLGFGGMLLGPPLAVILRELIRSTPPSPGKT